MNCTKCGHQLAEDANICTVCDSKIELQAEELPLSDEPSEQNEAATKKKITMLATLAALGIIVAVLIFLMSQNGDLSLVYESENNLTALGFYNGDVAIARIDGMYIWASELGHEMWLAEQELAMEYFSLHPFEFAIDYSREFRDGLTFGEVVIREAAINAATTLLFAAEAERLGVTLTDEQRSEMEMFLFEVWGDDITPLHEMGIISSRQLLNVLEDHQIRLNVLSAMFDELDASQRFDLAVQLDIVWAAQHILIGFEGFATDAEALALVESLYARLLAGEDFESLMLEYSDDQNPNLPPDTYTFTLGVMVPEFERGTRELEIGQISEPIRSFFGYHIIRRARPSLIGMLGDIDAALFDITTENFSNDARERIEFLTVPSWDELQHILEYAFANYEPRRALTPSEFVEINDSWIMIYMGEEISTSDFAFFSVLMQTPINRFTKHELLRELLTYLVVMEMGERYGVGFTQLELIEVEARAGFVRSLLEQEEPGSLDFISNRRLGEFMGLFEFVMPRLAELLIDYEPDEDAFRIELEQHINWLIESNTEVLVKYFATELDGIEEAALDLVVENYDFDDVVLKHCVLQTGLNPINIFEFAWRYGIDIDDWLFRLPIGQFSPIQMGGDLFFMFYIHDRIPPNTDPEILEMIEASFRAHTIHQRNEQLFFEMLQTWLDEADYELNHSLFNGIH